MTTAEALTLTRTTAPADADRATFHLVLVAFIGAPTGGRLICTPESTELAEWLGDVEELRSEWIMDQQGIRDAVKASRMQAVA